MRFSKTGNIFKIIKITNSQDNILGIFFSETDNGKTDIEVIKWDFSNSNLKKIQTSKEEVLNQVMSGLKSVNQSLGTNYKLSKIYFSPFDISANQIYSALISTLIRHYHGGGKLEEV